MLVVERLRKYYGKTPAVEDVSFEIKPGEIFALIGPNGAGKTTTLKSIMGFVRYEGRITFMDRELSEKVRIERFSFLPEEKRLYNHYRVSTTIEMAGKTVPNFDVERARDLVRLFSLKENAKVLELSHGMRTLLYLVLVISKDADLYILDEPTWGLDPVMRKHVFNLMNEIVSRGKSVLYTSHVLPEVDRIADEVALMKGGRLVFRVDLETLRSDYRIAFKRTKPEGEYEFMKELENGYLVLVRESEIAEEFDDIGPASVEDVFEMVIGEGRG